MRASPGEDLTLAHLPASFPTIGKLKVAETPLANGKVGPTPTEWPERRQDFCFLSSRSAASLFTDLPREETTGDYTDVITCSVRRFIIFRR